MADNKNSEPVATTSHKYATKTDVVINTLIENESRRKTCSPDMVAKMLDEYGSTMVAFGTTSASIYTGLKGIIGL